MAIALVILGSGFGWGVSKLISDDGPYGPLPQIPVQPPIATALAWFAAVHAHDMPLAQAHFAPADRGYMDWATWPPPFTHLDCGFEGPAPKYYDPGAQTEVQCTFDDINASDAGMSNTSFWEVDMQQDDSGRWLITSYGQP